MSVRSVCGTGQLQGVSLLSRACDEIERLREVVKGLSEVGEGKREMIVAESLQRFSLEGKEGDLQQETASAQKENEGGVEGSLERDSLEYNEKANGKGGTVKLREGAFASSSSSSSSSSRYRRLEKELSVVEALLMLQNAKEEQQPHKERYHGGAMRQRGHQRASVRKEGGDRDGDGETLLRLQQSLELIRNSALLIRADVLHMNQALGDYKNRLSEAFQGAMTKQEASQEDAQRRLEQLMKGIEAIK
uniref:Uncharacterized protein n=1 Tax=Chromera velia CCMP2878 TaxID=1169474 RepID=A0A0G4HSS2_9ALVE|mmetsp:Transcript_15888/g.32229  ORF Transcript_15888/g.32229 Transcript_15888/m.32229 type:complete len:248 (+) Transcript_15888:239-982(+)|eukprot:Cvel_8292.t1-p1 / transcript=Cvel_8292.t1 / gene=Cvel_8292 / organism=Chromera_velia_CCMP2878 / gene_product=hypothetical protein / transcript_product=hypothetical protein / location=Cvel_scaffold455:19853-25050(+) / protein_length=247 / sequence_SO=supercontig / SO=protein_coding / is_pseudo=false